MVSLCLYIADDGTLFYDKKECMEYEANKARNAAAAFIIGAKKNGEIVEYTNPYFLWEADIMVCKNEKAVTALQTLRNTSRSIVFQEMLEEVIQPGIYHWNEEDLKWILVKA